MINANPTTSYRMRRFGTASYVVPCSEEGLMPINNFRLWKDPRTKHVSGEAMAGRYNTKPSTCKPCSILCGHRGTYLDGETRQIPEYETVGLLGPNLGIFDSEVLSRWNELCGELGMDTISTGSVLGWTMEAGEKGLFETGLRFGSVEGVEDTIRRIALRQGEGDELAEGVKRLSVHRGGRDFAVHVKGLELAAYDPRGAWGQGLSYAVANRGGCHLSAYTVGIEILYGFMKPRSKQSKAFWVIFFENLFAAVNSLHTCQFTTFPYLLENLVPKYIPKPFLRLFMKYFPRVSKMLLDWSVFSDFYKAITGVPLSKKQFLLAGERVHLLERYMNVREGISAGDDVLPARFTSVLKEGFPEGSAVPLEKLKKQYYRLRGYTPSGAPKPALLMRLGIEGYAEPEGRPKAAAAQARGRAYPYRRMPRSPRADLYLRILMWFLGRGVQAASAFDPDVRRECNRLPPRYRWALRVLPAGPGMVIEKSGDGTFQYRGSNFDCSDVDLQIGFKHLGSAMLLFTFREGTAEAFTKDRMVAKGDLPAAMNVVRCLNAVEVYLLPKFLAKRAVKEYPKWTFGRKWRGRIRVYVGALLGF